MTSLRHVNIKFHKKCNLIHYLVLIDGKVLFLIDINNIFKVNRKNHLLNGLRLKCICIE